MLFATLLACFATLFIDSAKACNPLTTNGCPAIPGLASSTYSIDFRKEKSLPKDWILADSANVTFSDKGAEFNFNKRKDAPYIWTNFYVAFGRIDVEMQVAPGTGVITSAVMYSDDADEIDWEFSGSNLGAGTNNGKAQTNVFGKGFTGNYDRGSLQDVSPTPQTSFHIYSFEWTPDKIDWIIDGVKKFTTPNSGQKTGNYQFPQTPSRLHIGMWDAGDPDTADGTRVWAGGLTDYAKCPYVAYVRTVKITTPNPCKSWKYPDNFSGTWSSDLCTNETIAAPTSTGVTASAAKPKVTDATYTVVSGDNGYSIADKLGCGFEDLSSVNPGLNWDFLFVGQQLNNPNAARPSTVSALASCTTDECLNSMTVTQFSSSALAFCSSYNQTTTLATPTYLSGCSGNATRVKSACDCLAVGYAATTTAPTTSGQSVNTTTGVSSTGDTTKGLTPSTSTSAPSSTTGPSTTTTTSTPRITTPTGAKTTTKISRSKTSTGKPTTTSTKPATTTTTSQSTSNNGQGANYAGQTWNFWQGTKKQSHKRNNKPHAGGEDREFRYGRVGGGWQQN